MTNSKQENALEKSAKDSYTENKSFLDNFKNIFSGIFAYSSNKKDFVNHSKNNSEKSYGSSFYRTFI